MSFITKAKLKHGDHYDYSQTIYKNNKTKVAIICRKHEYLFYQAPNHHLNGHGCRKCSNETLKEKNQDNFSTFQDKAIIKHGVSYDYSKTKYVSSTIKVIILCKIHNKEFLQTPANHLRGRGCPLCGKDKTKISKYLSQEQFLSKAISKHGSKCDYSKSVYLGAKKYITIICREHGEFSQYPTNHLAGQGCPRCVPTLIAHSKLVTTEEYIEKAIQIHGERYDYSNTAYTNSRKKVAIGCYKHGFFFQEATSHLQGSGCPTCPTFYSKPHKEIEAYLDSLSITYQSNTRSIIPPKELDIYIPSHNLAIEFNGVYWHSVTQETSGDKYKHRNKYHACKDKGIQLLQIDQLDWENRRHIWESRLASILGLHKTFTPARKCMFKEISKEEAKVFLRTNHLQGGKCRSTYCFGLEYGNELVGVITFTNHEKGQLDLSRMAFKLGVTIQGGAQKLFKNSLKSLPAMDIVTLSHNQYSSGNVYKVMGFQMDKELMPSYQWYYQGKLMNKRRCRHKFLPKLLGELYDPKETEHQNMYRVGARCLYDAGYIRWVYKR